MLDYLAKELDRLNLEGLLRKPKVITEVKGARVKIAPPRQGGSGTRTEALGGKWYISFCTNDYLGLAQHPKVKAAMIRVTKKLGAGAGAARLLAGNSEYHSQLEQAIAKYKKADDGLLFTSGFVANLGVIGTLVKKEDVIFCDELNHASLIDAARLARAELHVYRHRDVKHLEKLLQSEGRGRKDDGRKTMDERRGTTDEGRITQDARRFIVTDAIFSMDGDAAPLKDIVRLAKKHKAYTIVDEAHGTGVFGKYGRGLCEELGVEKEVDIIIGTLSKAMGAIGGFLAGPQVLVDYIRNKSRPFIFTTSLPPGVCAGAISGIKILQQQPSLRKKLWDNTKYIKSRLDKMGFDMRGSISPIIPIMIGDTKKTVAISQALWDKRLYVPAIRPPTVPLGQSRLRLTITAMHTRKDLDLVINALEELIKK